MKEVRTGLLQKQRIREQTISTLKQLLFSHDKDERYNHPHVRKRICGLYFPFVLTSLEFNKLLNEYLVYEEKVNWLLCYFYILYNCDRELLYSWWSDSSQEKQVDFFFMIEMATKVFINQNLVIYNSISFLIVKIVTDLLIQFKSQLSVPNSSSIILPKIIEVLLALNNSQSPAFTKSFYLLLAVFVDTFSRPIFW